jgi:hypothetical protein
MSYVLLAPKVYSGAPLHFRILFASAGRLSDLDDSQMFPIDFAKVSAFLTSLDMFFWDVPPFSMLSALSRQVKGI